MNDINFDFSTFDEREKREQEEQAIREATAAREATEAQEETVTATPEPAAQKTEQKAEKGPDLLGGMPGTRPSITCQLPR